MTSRAAGIAMVQLHERIGRRAQQSLTHLYSSKYLNVSLFKKNRHFSSFSKGIKNFQDKLSL